MSATKMYVKNGPLLELVDSHYPCFKDIKGLDFKISIVMSATDITFVDSVNRELQAERLVLAWNRYDPLVDELAAARALLSEVLDIHDAATCNDLQGIFISEFAARIRTFLKG